MGLFLYSRALDRQYARSTQLQLLLHSHELGQLVPSVCDSLNHALVDLYFSLGSARLGAAASLVDIVSRTTRGVMAPSLFSLVGIDRSSL